MKNFILNFTFLLFGVTLFAQNTWTVDNRPGTTAQFTSLQAAIDAAAEGDFIYIHPSATSYSNVTLIKRLHLRGIGHNPELGNGLSANLSSLQLSTQSSSSPSGSSISGLNISSFQINSALQAFSDVVIQNNRIGSLTLTKGSNCIVQGNIFNPQFASAIFFGSGTNANNLISNNIFNSITNGSASEACIAGVNESTTVTNNIFIFNGTSGNPGIFRDSTNPIANNNIFVLNNNVSNDFRNPNSTVSFQNCLTFSYGGQTINALNGNNNLNNTNPQFVNIGTPENPAFTYNKNYKLQVGSPAIDAGSDGDDLGIYGQGFLFQMKGYPFDLPYPTSINITNAVVEAGGNLSVDFKASANVEN